MWGGQGAEWGLTTPALVRRLRHGVPFKYPPRWEGLPVLPVPVFVAPRVPSCQPPSRGVTAFIACFLDRGLGARPYPFCKPAGVQLFGDNCHSVPVGGVSST